MNRVVVPVLLAVAGALSATEGPADWNNLGAKSFAAHDYAAAEKLYLRALTGWKQAGESRSQVRTMSNLAVLYRAEGRYRDAESLYLEALHLMEAGHFHESPEAVTTLNNLAEMYRSGGEAARGERHARESVALAGRVFGAEHPAAADGLHTLAAICRDLGRPEEALELYGRARRLIEKSAGPRDPRLVANLANTAEVRMAQGEYSEAETLSRRALALAEESAGVKATARAQALNNLAQALRLQKRYDEAEPLYRQALAILDRDPASARILANLAGFYHDRENESRAVEYYTRALEVLESSLGPEHPETALIRTRLAEVRRAQGHYAESLALFRSSVPLLERSYGVQDPRVLAAVHEFERATAEAKRHTVAVR